VHHGAKIIKNALQKAPFNNLSPESVLELVEIDDLIAAGYTYPQEQI
jgi:hypothetical protein